VLIYVKLYLSMQLSCYKKKQRSNERLLIWCYQYSKLMGPEISVHLMRGLTNVLSKLMIILNLPCLNLDSYGRDYRTN
jgi:hypothetical protein